MKETIKILLINAINPNFEVQTRYPSLGLAYLASYSRAKLSGVDIQFKIIDRNIEKITSDFKPHLVGISFVTQNVNIAINYINYINAINIPIIIGGIHLSSLPDTLPDNVIAGCLGEGEITFAEILETFINSGNFHENIKKIPGIVYKDDGVLKYTEHRETIRNLDTIPLPARDLLRIHPHTYMFTSRGCPYSCSFCASTRYWDKVRYFSAEYVVDEIDYLVNHHQVSLISFFDDLFIAKPSRLEKILIGLEQRNLIGKVKFTCSCRAELVDNKTAEILLKMGVRSVGMGLESGDEETLKFLKGNTASVEKNLRSIDILKNHGIFVNASFIIGSPYETEEQMMKTYQFIKQSRLDLFDIYFLTPYPNTPIWDYAKKRGLVSHRMDWRRLDVNAYSATDKIILLSEKLSKPKLISIYKKFRRLRFYRNLSRVWNHPMKTDIPRMAIKLLIENYSIIWQRLKGALQK